MIGDPVPYAIPEKIMETEHSSYEYLCGKMKYIIYKPRIIHSIDDEVI
jgi:hypothetical protein